MVKESISNKARRKHVCSSEKKKATKTVLDQNKINMEELLILEFFNKTMILLELAGYKMIITT